MANKNSTGVTNIEASPIVVRDRKRSDVKVVIDQVALDAADVDNANDNILICPVPSNSVITDIVIRNDDLDADACPTLAVNVGLAYSGIGGNQANEGRTSGEVISADCFASAITDLQAANTSGVSVRFEAANITTLGDEAWEIAGLSSDPGGLLYIVLDVSTAAATAAAGDLTVTVNHI